jgi:hypothetical protein
MWFRTDQLIHAAWRDSAAQLNSNPGREQNSDLLPPGSFEDAWARYLSSSPDSKRDTATTRVTVTPVPRLAQGCAPGNSADASTGRPPS